MVILMIFVGGVTRLSDAGLSIVQWQPITGIIPPIGEIAWQVEFAKYQAFPEYQVHNYGMSLAQFKFIYLLEYIHRLLGRITGLIYLLPLIYFYLKNQIKKPNILPYIIILILFFIQGFMGWYMVRSGLVNHPHVSHFRLATHLIIAILIYHLLFNQLLKNNFDILLISREVSLKFTSYFCTFSIILVYIQIFLGGLVAGLDAGLIYNSFPLMGNNFIPVEIKNNFFVFSNLWEPVFIQFIHRIAAYSIFIITLLLIGILLKKKHPKLNKVALCLIVTLTCQILTGIITVLYFVPLTIALLHQIFAIALLSSLLWCYYLVKN